MQIEMAQQSGQTATYPSTATDCIRLKNILVPIDFSKLSRKSLNYAIALARQFDATLCLLHVVEQTPPFTGLETIPVAMDIRQESSDASRQLLEFAARNVPS